MSTGVAVKPSKKHKQHKTQEERLEDERLERYNKLVHMATRAIHKEVKMVKSFECQKIVNGRTLDVSLFESTTETEGSVTETDNSFTKNFDEFSLKHFDDNFPDNKSDTSDNNVDTQLNVRSDMPVSIMRKRIIPDSV
jgi:hypothetical protein